MSYRITNPATDVVEREYELATDTEIADAIARAHAEYLEWSTRPLDERIAVIRRVAELYRERRDELAEIIAREMGKPIAFGRGEVGISADIYEYYASSAPKFLADEELEVASGGRALVRTAPIGVLLGIMPWNYPYYQVARFAAPNLLLGNTILLKHASNCPESAAAIAQIFEDAGLPAGAYRNLYVSSRQVPAIIADDRVAGVSLTGSEAAGRAVARGGRPPPEEVRHRARRQRPLHRALDERPRLGREGRGHRPHGERGTGVQCLEARDRRR